MPPNNPPVKTDKAEALPAEPTGLQALRPNFMPVMSLEEAKSRRDQFKQFVHSLLVEGVDYGKVPGSDRPALLKPGAEKLNTLFGLVPTFELVERVEDWTGKDHGDEPFFYYFYKCRLWRGADTLQGEGDGSCNSMESKYRYRWVPLHEVPAASASRPLKTRGGRRSEPDFAIARAETLGQYGKPAAYWREFQTAIDNGTAVKITKHTKAGKAMPAWEIDATLYRVPNEDIPDQVNTIQKMAQKRALVGATLIAINASDYFTQDIEDADTIDVTPVVAAGAGAAPAQSEEGLVERGQRIFKDICKLCNVTATDVADFLRDGIGVENLNEADAYSKLAKLNLVWDANSKKPGDGKEIIMAGALRWRSRNPLPTSDAAPEPPREKAKKKGASGPAPNPLVTLYATVGRKAGGDGIKLLNTYLDQQFQRHDVPNIQPQTEIGDRILKALEALERLTVEQLRAVLTNAPQDEVEGDRDRELFDQTRRSLTNYPD